jgi:Immunoglobulin-like domain of bacterial spore germination
LLAVLLVIVLTFFFVSNKVDAPGLTEIKSFEDCAKAGYPIMESYPRQCKVPDGRTYAEEIVEKITYVNSSADLIMVDLPFPGAVTGKTFSVSGKARGNWYFEASFPVEVRDSKGNVLVQKPAQAQSEWMTTDFVPFKVDLTVPESFIGPATLVLRKDNPSGLPEHDAFIMFPITIEY